MDTTPLFSLPFPEDTDAPNGPLQLQALAEAIENVHGVIAVNSSGVSINSSATVTNTLSMPDAEIFDSDGYHSTVTNNHKLTIPSGKGGLYFLLAQVKFQANSSGIRRLQMDQNTSTVDIASAQSPAAASGTTTVTLAHLALLAAGDNVDVHFGQNSGSTLSATGYFGAILLGSIS